MTHWECGSKRIRWFIRHDRPKFMTGPQRSRRRRSLPFIRQLGDALVLSAFRINLISIINYAASKPPRMSLVLFAAITFLSCPFIRFYIFGIFFSEEYRTYYPLSRDELSYLKIVSYLNTIHLKRRLISLSFEMPFIFFLIFLCCKNHQLLASFFSYLVRYHKTSIASQKHIASRFG